MRARALAAVALASALAAPAAAQVTVEDEIVTSSVTFEIKDDGLHSLMVAMALSAALPGAGHYYVGKPRPAFAYMAVDVASLFGALAFSSLASAKEINARSFAQAAAGIEKAPSGEAYWRHVGAFMDAAAYNEAVELSRGSIDDQFTNPENAWRWPDESLKDQYNAERQKARNLRVASSFFVGALVANRILSVVDLRVFQKKRLSSNVKFEPAFMPSRGGVGLAVIIR